MLCPCKLTPLQSRLLASVLTLALLGIIFWTVSHPPAAYAAELEFTGVGDSRDGEDHNWHRIAQEALSEDGIDEDGTEGRTETRILSARAPTVSTTAGNNAPNLDNIEPGSTTVWEFTSEQLRSQPGEIGSGLPKNVTRTTKPAVQHAELRRRDLEGAEDRAVVESRQIGPSKLIYISINTCLQPNYVGSGTQSVAAPQLTLYVATERSNRDLGPNGNDDNQRSIGLDAGYAATSIEADGDWYVAVHAPDISDDFDGVWNYELAVSIDDYYHSVELNNSNLFLLDSDSSAALLVTDNLTQSDSSSTNYKQWMDLPAPYILFASNIDDTQTKGLANSFCGMNKNSQIVGDQEEIDGEGTNVQMEMITRGLGNKPKEQFHVTALNRSSTYHATLAQVGNSTNSGQGVVGGGGKVWRATNFTTKTDGNCALLFNLDFCSEVAYAVPSRPSIVANYTNFKFIFDNYTLTYYHNFNYSLQQIPCHTEPESQYSLARNCADCAKAYKDWLCAVSIPRCEDFSVESRYYLRRNMGQPFINGSTLPTSLLEERYVPMNKAPTLEGTVAYNQTYISSHATKASRNPIIDNIIAPGPYKEILPCEDLCYGLMQSCPAALGFGCPFPGRGLEAGYGSRIGNGNGSLSCSFLGAYVYTGGGTVWHGTAWQSVGIAVVIAAVIVGI